MERDIESTATLHASIDAARAILRATPDAVFGEPDTDASSPGRRVFASALPAPLGSGATVEQAVSVTLGPVRTGDHGRVVAPLSWEPKGRERVLPSFTGELVIETTADLVRRLVVRGSYTAPLGPVGRLGDAVVGRRVARESVAAYVTRLAERVEREAVRRQREEVLKPAPYNEDLRPHSRSEHHIG